MSSGLCLVTRGYVCVPEEAEVMPITSCASPDVQQILEVRPRIRGLVAEVPSSVDTPVTTSTQELKPSMRGVTAPEPPSPDNRPVPHVTIELRPIIKDVEED
jgi:hypothetical protein